MKKRNNTLDLIRGIAILCVVLGHALLSVLYDKALENWLYQLIISFQMALLMFVSGIAAGNSFPTNQIGAFLKKKVWRLFIPYVCWSFVYTILNTVVCKKDWSVMLFVEAFYNSDFWFLRFLFVFYLMLALVNGIYIIFKKKIPILILIFLSIGVVYLLTKCPYINTSISVWYYCWFLLGLAISSQLKWIEKNLIIFQAVGCAAIDAMIVSIIAIVWRGEVRGNIVPYIWVIGLCYLCYFTKKILPEPITSELITIGKNTLPIYAIHWCLLFAPWHNAGIFVKITTTYILPEAIWVIIFFALFLIGTFAINWILKKNRVTSRLLLGEK